MRQISFRSVALSCFLMFAPFLAFGQSTTTYDDTFTVNLCDPESLLQFEEGFLALGPEVHPQAERVRIELMERGYDPGFEADRAMFVDTQLKNAITDFQFDNDLAITGQIDPRTLYALSIPVPDTAPAAYRGPAVSD